LVIQNLRNNEAVSEIIGEIILLAIAISLISVIFTQVLSTPGPQDTTRVTIIGKIEENQPVFEIQRGEPLGLDTIIFINIAGTQNEYSLDQHFIQEYIHNQEWNIGERIILPPVDFPINEIPRVEATIVDTKTNSIVFRGILQEGFVTLH